MRDIDRQYQETILHIRNNGKHRENKRTNNGVTEVHGHTIVVEPEHGFPILALRRIEPRVFVGEQLWFLTGSRTPADFLDRYAKVWSKFTNLDGVISTAYGYRWRHHFGRDQITALVSLMEKDPSSRHGVVVTWDPESDGLGGVSKKNVPCPYTFTVNIDADNMLHLDNIIRSNDMVPGFPFDMAGFSLLQRLLAARLGVTVGKHIYHIANAHIYDVHQGIAPVGEDPKDYPDVVSELLTRRIDHSHVELELKPEYFDIALNGQSYPQDLHQVATDIISQINDQYKPMPTIKGIKVVE